VRESDQNAVRKKPQELQLMGAAAETMNLKAKPPGLMFQDEASFVLI
jgi:hypothetical protein